MFQLAKVLLYYPKVITSYYKLSQAEASNQVNYSFIYKRLTI